jgi:hypothetical protein
VVPSLSDLLEEEEEHEVSIRRRRARHKRAADSASKICRSRRLAAKENPFYVNATSKATRVRVKEAQLDLSKASERIKSALAGSGLLERPPPVKVVSKSKLRCLGHVCGLSHLSELDVEEVPVV